MMSILPSAPTPAVGSGTLSMRTAVCASESKCLEARVPRQPGITEGKQRQLGAPSGTEPRRQHCVGLWTLVMVKKKKKKKNQP